MVEWIKLQAYQDYLEIINIMEKKVVEIIDQQARDTIYLLEYKDIYTAGSSYNIYDNEILSSTPIKIINTDRGGKLTFHGPGQRIIYPVIKLTSFGLNKDIKKYVNNLSQWIINTLNYFGIISYKLDNLVGIWVKINNQDKKIASIGVRVKKWVAYHGIAININTELSNFLKIIPCGLKDTETTSLKELGINITMDEFDLVLKEQFSKIFTCIYSEN